jgi:hypothetical protein
MAFHGPVYGTIILNVLSECTECVGEAQSPQSTESVFVAKNFCSLSTGEQLLPWPLNLALIHYQVLFTHFLF